MPQTLADRLRWARMQSGLSQSQVAEKFGWHRPTVSQIEAGQRLVKSQELDTFAKLYDVKLQWLLDGDDGLEVSPQIEVAARELAKLSEKDLGHATPQGHLQAAPAMDFMFRTFDFQVT